MEKEGDVPRERCQLAFDSVNNASSISEEVREQRKKTDYIAINIPKYGSLLDEKLSDIKSLRSQVSEGIKQFQQTVADNKQWLAADNNRAKETVASLKKAMTDVNDALLSDVEKLSSTTTNVADELVKVSEKMRVINIATEPARTQKKKSTPLSFQLP